MSRGCPHCGKKGRFHRHRKRTKISRIGFEESKRRPRIHGLGKKSVFNGHTIEHKIAFLGNPNVGKSSLFNTLTGSHQHIGNWPGKTVERKEGHFILSDEYFSLVDLPGTYSLSARSEEELVTRQFIVEEKPDLVCVIADATRLERTLFVALQVMELMENVAVIINMKDLAEKECIDIDIQLLEKKLGIPIVYACAYEDDSIIRIKKFIYDSLHTKKYEFNPAMVVYSPKIEYMIQNISDQIEDRETMKEYPTRWIAFRILEGDHLVIEELSKEYDFEDMEVKIAQLVKEEKFDPTTEISKRKYNALHHIVHDALQGYEDFKETSSDKIDKAILHKIWGYPILIAIFAAFFLLTFYASTPIINGIDWVFLQFSNWVMTSLESVNSPAFLNSLLVDGIISGISAVILFIPIILIFYALIAILEDSGYLARSAYLMDRVMGKFGMQGSAFLSLIMGFGCNVAGIMATRTIKNQRDRTAMIIANSFIPCAARLGVIAFLTGIFFQPWLAALIMLVLYGVSILLVLFTGFLFRIFYKKEEPLPLIMELPEYRRPRLRNVFHLTWERAGVFLKKAGTFIFLASILIWFISNIPFGAAPEYTIAGYIGRGLSVITMPLFGFDWKMVVPLLFGIPAKEAIISALSILYSAGGSVVTALKASWSIPQAISFLLFQLTYAPCFATMATIKSETKSWKMTALGFFYPLIITIILTVIVFQIFSAIL
jgi:ferrous iron transport protein B